MSCCSIGSLRAFCTLCFHRLLHEGLLALLLFRFRDALDLTEDLHKLFTGNGLMLIQISAIRSKHSLFSVRRRIASS